MFDLVTPIYIMSMLVIHMAETVVNDPAQQDNPRVIVLKKLGVEKWRHYHSVWMQTGGTIVVNLLEGRNPFSARLSSFARALFGHIYHYYNDEMYNQYTGELLGPDRDPFVFRETPSPFEKNPADFEEFLNALVSFFEENKGKWNYERLKQDILYIFRENIGNINFRPLNAWPYQSTMAYMYPDIYTDYREWSRDGQLMTNTVRRFANDFASLEKIDFDKFTGPGAKEYIRKVLLDWYDRILRNIE